MLALNALKFQVSGSFQTGNIACIAAGDGIRHTSRLRGVGARAGPADHEPPVVLDVFPPTFMSWRPSLFSVTVKSSRNESLNCLMT